MKELTGIQITQLYAGNYYSIAVSDRGILYGWGENKNFVMGTDTFDYINQKANKASQVYYWPQKLIINKDLGVRKIYRYKIKFIPFRKSRKKFDF